MKNGTCKIRFFFVIAFAMTACSGKYRFKTESDDAKEKSIEAMAVPSVQRETASEPGEAAASDSSSVMQPPTPEATTVVNPMPKWHCNVHEDALSHEIPMENFRPNFANAYKLYLRPYKTHCTGIALDVYVTNNNTKKRSKLLCTSTTCRSGSFIVHIGGKDAWEISLADFKNLTEASSENDTYTLTYAWTTNIESPGSTCYGDIRADYGVAFAMSLVNDPSPSASDTADDCSKFAL